MANEFQATWAVDGLTTLVARVFNAAADAQIGADVPLSQNLAGANYVGDLPAGLAEGEYNVQYVNTADTTQKVGVVIYLDATGAQITEATVNARVSALETATAAALANIEIMQNAVLFQHARLGQNCKDAAA